MICVAYSKSTACELLLEGMTDGLCWRFFYTWLKRITLHTEKSDKISSSLSISLSKV